MNNINIIGTLTRDVELKYLPSSLAVANFAIAVNQDYKKQDGTKIEKVSFFDVKVMGKQSEIINTYFFKGSRIGITGELYQETWIDNNQQNRSKVVIKLRSFSFIDRKSDNAPQSGHNQQNAQMQNNQQYNQNVSDGNNMVNNRSGVSNDIPTIDIDNDEIPF